MEIRSVEISSPRIEKGGKFVGTRFLSSQETAKRTSAATPADTSGSDVTIVARSSLGSVGASLTSSIRVKPGGKVNC